VKLGRPYGAGHAGVEAKVRSVELQPEDALEIVLGHPASRQVVFAGPFGVGKTTALRAISEIPVVNTDVASRELDTAQRAGGKTTTTAGFDYGEFRLAAGERVAVFGLPGQERFDAMWDLLVPASAAVVLWAYGDQPDGVNQCATWLRALGQRAALLRVAVAVSRLPLAAQEAGLAPYRALVQRLHPLAVVQAADPRAAEDVRRVVAAALTALPGAVRGD